MRRTRIRCLVAAAGAVLTVSGATVSPAIADEPTDGVLAAITEAAPDAVANAAAIDPDPSDRNAIDASVAGTDIIIPTDPAQGISLAQDGSEVSVELPFAARALDAAVEDAGTVSYDNTNGSTTVPVVRIDGSVQINTVITRAGAPTRYDYALDLPTGGRIERVAGGSLALLDSHSAFIGGLAPAWAVDANGKSVPTHYEVDGTVVTQVVDHSKADAYPVVADPYLGLQMVQSATWTTRDSRGRTLVVTPTGWARAFGGAYLAGVYGWPEVEQRQASVRGNTQLQWQYICHQQFAFIKATWNLDTWVRRGSYADSVAHKCN